MSSFIIVYCSIDDLLAAKKLATLVVENKLAACVTLLPQVYSVYRWQEQVQQDDEILMLFKTKQTQFESLKTFIKKYHPYEVPEIIAVPIVEGEENYLNWIKQCVAD